MKPASRLGPPRPAVDQPSPLWVAVFAAVLSGPINAAAFPDRGWWPLVFLGTGLMLFSLAGRSWRGSLLVGLVGGFAFWGTHIFWLTIYLGPVPWLALAGLQSIFFALGGLLVTLAWRYVPLLWPGTFGRLGLLPAVLGVVMRAETVKRPPPPAALVGVGDDAALDVDLVADLAPTHPVEQGRVLLHGPAVERFCFCPFHV